ncbi:MAG: DUF2851 family protein [Chloroflexi bacterium]|nr:DUF2851 family protein [Chloroflexota bacterium]
MPNNLTENQIIEIWQHQLLERKRLVTEGGESIEIVYPGRRNDDRGADFRDAVIVTRRGLMKGDVEVHVKSSGWREHRHHRDVVYNRVILHVVMWHNTKRATCLQNGREVPVLALNNYIKTPLSHWRNGDGSLTRRNRHCLAVAPRRATASVAGFLDRAGEERFLAKAARFQADLAQVAASQCLYRGIMGALGYSRNKLPFLELAGRLPLTMLESITQGVVSDEECLARQQALLLGTAGLLPSQRRNKPPENDWDDGWLDKLERRWTSCRRSRVMSADAWHLFKIRPNNSPIRRLVAMSYLLLRYRERGLLAGLISLVKEAPLSRGDHRLEKGLLVTTSGYWASHLDFGPGGKISSPTLLGKGRAADIIVNVLLPFTFAWGAATAQAEAVRQAFNLYRRYPRLTVNSVERQMTAQLGLSRRLVNSAQRQQGLIHIYNNLCSQGRCNSCPLKNQKTL